MSMFICPNCQVCSPIPNREQNVNAEKKSIKFCNCVHSTNACGRHCISSTRHRYSVKTAVQTTLRRRVYLCLVMKCHHGSACWRPISLFPFFYILFVADIPLDLRIREGSDAGAPVTVADPDSSPVSAFTFLLGVVPHLAHEAGVQLANTEICMLGLYTSVDLDVGQGVSKIGRCCCRPSARTH